ARNDSAHTRRQVANNGTPETSDFGPRPDWTLRLPRAKSEARCPKADVWCNMQFAVAAASARRENALCYNRTPFNQTPQSFSCLVIYPAYATLTYYLSVKSSLKAGGAMNIKKTLF